MWFNKHFHEDIDDYEQYGFFSVVREYFAGIQGSDYDEGFRGTCISILRKTEARKTILGLLSRFRKTGLLPINSADFGSPLFSLSDVCDSIWNRKIGGTFTPLSLDYSGKRESNLNVNREGGF
jgi:hypothetical protein